MNVVSSGGIHAHPAAEPAGRGRLHPANADSPGANHHLKGSLNTPRSLRSAKSAEAAASALSASPCEPTTPRLRVLSSAPSACHSAAEGAENASPGASPLQDADRHAWLPGGDAAGDGRGRDRVGRGEVEAAGPGATGEVAVLRADRHLVGPAAR